MKQDVIYFIESCSISMFPIKPETAKREMPWGKADVDNPIFMGALADKINMVEKFETTMQRLTGSKFPRPRQRGAQEHELRIQQVWLTQPDDSDDVVRDDWVLDRDALYWIVMTWYEDDKETAISHWKARIYGGVSTPSRVLEGSDESVAFMDDKVLTAMFCKHKHGIGVIPSLV